jgi:predicted dehydrogenase
MIDEENPDIASIAPRPANHAEITIFAAEHGVKGIYCEKPLCDSMEEANAMFETCSNYEVKSNYGTQRRYMPVYPNLVELRLV